MSKHFIETRDLTFTYEEEEIVGKRKNFALNGVSVCIEKGEYVAVVGRNGSGKSTFAKLLNLVLEPTGGEILINGKAVNSDITDEDLLELRRTVGMVFQNPDNQIVATIVEEDVAFGPENLGVSSDEIKKRVYNSLAAVGMLDYAKHEPHRLSGGQKQRIAIAGIMAMMPECMIFDESTSMLDPIGRREVLSVMDKLVHEKGITVLNITHHMNEAAMADRIIVIDNGRVIADGKPTEIFSNEEIISRAGLELPQCATLLHALADSGIQIPEICIDAESTAELIAEMINKK